MKCYEKQSRQTRYSSPYPPTRPHRAVRPMDPSPFPPTAPQHAVRLQVTRAQLNGQYPTEWRIVYTLLIGWWLALQWSIVAMFLDTCHIPAGQTMMAKLPAVFCLQR